MRSLFAICLFLPLVGCAAQNKYTPPEKANIVKSTVVNSSFDQTWDRLITHAAESFFGIENFEKDSGLVTLSFGVGNAAQFIDCGTFGERSYVRDMEWRHNARLSGKMNLRVVSEGAGRTRVVVNARYVFMYPSYIKQGWLGPSIISGRTWTFESTTSSTGVGTTCRSTGLAEKTILDAVS